MAHHNDAGNGLTSDPALDLSLDTQGLYVQGGKRLLDTFLILLALPILLPFLFVVALVVMMDGRMCQFSTWKYVV